ncbi:hypothetical protein GBA63_19680 [Rubrobacter tropicus]|uniref:TNase-like domain-containing protein n=1 Tax=Rubrobacter tropicus TaxID=2653851 RepID=A0A6G8QDZ3_9ACTN|nr:thermonuclease family protein [Rubrobacter tropicus]QIN84621.1 hypothetical protein GBA63_19680 [Rubrobacter tropicus]
MPTSLYRTVRSRRPTGALLLALAVLFVLGPATGIASAQEDASGLENSLETVVRDRTSAGGSSGKSGAPGNVEVGAGEATAGDAYAGNGCARAGDVTAGDCEEEASRGGSSNGGSSDSPSNNPGRPKDDEETIVPETTAAEVTQEETTLLEGTAEGEATSTASPDPARTDLCPIGPPEDAVEATIEDATDGDTVELAEEVDGHGTVRLIGVDTPELNGEDGRPEPLAEEASDFTAEELEGMEVLLQVGADETDEYGRLIAYVWTAPDDGFVGGLKRMVGMGEAELFNHKLLEKGYAEVLTIEPNDLYAECFEDAERDARAAGVGIWADDESSAGPSQTQYDEETTQETTTENPPSSDTAPVENNSAENTPEETPTPEGLAREGSERRPSPTEAQYEQSTPSEASSPGPEVQKPEIQEPKVQESIAPSGGDEAAVLETPSSPGISAYPVASASSEPTSVLPAETASTAPITVLPETGGPSLSTLGLGLGVALLGGIAMGSLAVRAFLGPTHPDRR